MRACVTIGGIVAPPLNRMKGRPRGSDFRNVVRRKNRGENPRTLSSVGWFGGDSALKQNLHSIPNDQKANDFPHSSVLGGKCIAPCDPDLVLGIQEGEGTTTELVIWGTAKAMISVTIPLGNGETGKIL